MQQGRLQEARVALEDASAADPDPDAGSEPWLTARGQLAQFDGRADEVVGDFERRIAALRRQPPGVELVVVLASLGSLYSETGQDARAVALLEEGWRLAQRLGARYAQVEVAVNLLRALTDLQRDEEAITIAREALALGEYDASATLRNNLAWSLRESGRLDEARLLYEALRRGSDPTLALMAGAKLVEMSGEAQDAVSAQHGAQQLLAAMASTEVYLAHAIAVLAVLRFGTDSQVQQAQTHLRAQALDPSLNARLGDALRARGIDPAPYLHAASTAP
jgi:tetratricopeptide (TPR) repeat protein